MVTYLKDKATITAYSSDGSIYSISPRAIKPVKYVGDVIDSVRFALQEKISITPRGGGTGVAGGALGDGIILDFSDFRSILNVDVSGQAVVTQTGIIYDELNIALKKHGLFFPPDPSSGDSCQIGGMIAGNSSGPGSVKYGLTSDFVEELSIVASSGQVIELRKLPVDSAEMAEFFRLHPEYEKIYGILRDNRQLIEDNWPRVKKNSAGYNLLQAVRDLNLGIFNLPALFTGSEGTLGIFISAKLRLLPLPQEKLTLRLYFHSLVEAGRAVPEILALGPSGLEIVDGSTLNLIGRDRFGIPPSAAALLLVEFDDRIESKKVDFLELAGRLNLASPVESAADAESTAALWRARKAIVPTLYRHHPRKRPVALIEDVSIPPDAIPAFIEYATSLFDSHHLTYGIFGHIGDGNLHIRPLFDLNDKDDLSLASSIYDRVYDKVISMGGSTTAEHADGRLRAPLVRRMYGNKIYGIFCQIKELLDPNHILSPDKVLSDRPFTEKIDFEKIKSYCAACGKCNGYCPAYDIFRREDYSPRGWLRMINQAGEKHRKLKKYLAFCLNCKNCAIVCPAGVDIAGEIIKHRALKPSRTSNAIVRFADNESLLDLSLKLGRLAAPLANNRYSLMLPEFLGKKPFGLDRSAVFPSIAPRNLRERYADRVAEVGKVALFHGCADNLLDSKVGDAIIAVFDRLGIRVSLPEQKCCGLPQEIYGHHENLLNKARYNIDKLDGFKIVITGCASCLLRLKEYKKLFTDNDPYQKKAIELSDKCYDISQYLNSLDMDYSVFNTEGNVAVTYHNPCHLRAAGLHREPEKLLGKLANIRIIHPLYADRCCAQAGSFGFIHFQESKRMFEKKKDDYGKIEAEYLMTSCPACQMKIRAEMGDKFRVVHPVEILAGLMKKG